MTIHLTKPPTQESYYVSTVHFESQTDPLGGYLWTNGPVPPLGDYLLTPFDYKIRLIGPQSEDNHFKFHRIGLD